jgi:hypothetical protein
MDLVIADLRLWIDECVIEFDYGVSFAMNGLFPSSISMHFNSSTVTQRICSKTLFFGSPV